jgi:hypothetical protein
MLDPIPSSESLITPEQIFIAYAEMKDSRESFPKTKEYYEKRWRLISDLFEIGTRTERMAMFHESALLNGLASYWLSSSNYNPLGTPYLGRHPEPDFSIAASHKDSLARKAAALRSEYRQMGGELIIALFPEIKERHVSIGRLHELGLPFKAPNENEECLEHFEQSFLNEEEDAPVESISDNVSREQMDKLKLAEEVLARANAALAIDVAAVRKLALEQGLATEESIDKTIYEMAIPEFLKLASGYPKVSRIHFNPALKSSASQ